MLGAEQAAGCIVLQGNGIVVMQSHERYGDVLDQCRGSAQSGLLLGTTLPHALQDVGECLPKRTKTRTLSFEIESLRVVGVARRVKESRHLAIGAAHVMPQLSDDCRQYSRRNGR